MDAILKAAIHVLAKEGAPRFTTARIAERAGVSIGSLYQYFPNKAAILFRLQRDEWRATTDLLRTLLGDRSLPPLERLRPLVHVFLRSECEEAPMRVALNDAAPLYRDAPEAQALREEGDRVIEDYMREVLPGVSDCKRELVSDLVMTTLGEVCKSFSEKPRTETEVKSYANAMADMFHAYLTAESKARHIRD